MQCNRNIRRNEKGTEQGTKEVRRGHPYRTEKIFIYT